MRTRDMKTLNPLKSLLTAHQSNQKDVMNKKPKTPLSHFESDAFLTPLIYRQIAKRRDSLAGYKAYHRHDLAEKEEAEITVLETYLPQPQTSVEDIRAMTVEAFEALRTNGDGANDPGSMSLNRIFEYLKGNEILREKLEPTRVDQVVLRRVVAETVKSISDRIDSAPAWNVEKLKPKSEDTLTKERYQ